MKQILINKFQVHLIKSCMLLYVSPDCPGILRSYALKDTAQIQNYTTILALLLQFHILNIIENKYWENTVSLDSSPLQNYVY